MTEFVFVGELYLKIVIDQLIGYNILTFMHLGDLHSIIL